MNLSHSPVDLQDLIAQILSSQSISRLEQQRMSLMLQYNQLDEQEKTLIERVFYGLRHGLLVIVD